MKGGKLDILVVDDQPGVRYLMDVIITDLKHNVRLAQNGLEAVEAVKAAKPDLIFMDIRMPHMDGVEALGIIKNISPETEVVIMTAYVSDETEQLVLNKGALCCFSKPFDVDVIISFINEFSFNMSALMNNALAVGE